LNVYNYVFIGITDLCAANQSQSDKHWLRSQSISDQSNLILVVCRFSSIAVILRHDRENRRIVCNFSIWTVTDVYRKAVLWQRNHITPL